MRALQIPVQVYGWRATYINRRERAPALPCCRMKCSPARASKSAPCSSKHATTLAPHAHHHARHIEAAPSASIAGCVAQPAALLGGARLHRRRRLGRRQVLVARQVLGRRRHGDAARVEVVAHTLRPNRRARLMRRLSADALLCARGAAFQDRILYARKAWRAATVAVARSPAPARRAARRSILLRVLWLPMRVEVVCRRRWRAL